MKMLLAKPLVAIIRIYQYVLSPLSASCCRFHPSCSHYALDALQRHGIVTGGWLALRRLARCHPWHRGGFDPVPEALTRAHKQRSHG